MMREDKVEERNKLNWLKVAWKRKDITRTKETMPKGTKEKIENDGEMKFGISKIRRDEVWEKCQGKKCNKI